jgi:hypothetical protein
MVGRTERDYRQDVLRFELRTLFFRMTVSVHNLRMLHLQNQQPHKQLPQSDIDAHLLSMAILIYQSRYRSIRIKATNSIFKVRIARSVVFNLVVHLSDFH